MVLSIPLTYNTLYYIVISLDQKGAVMQNLTGIEAILEKFLITSDQLSRTEIYINTYRVDKKGVSNYVIELT